MDWYFLNKHSHALQNLDHSLPYYTEESYKISIPIPKQIFNNDYPVNPKTFGERLRKARMDAGFQIREFAEIIGVTENTVINWELRGMRPLRKSEIGFKDLLRIIVIRIQIDTSLVPLQPP